MGLLVARYLIEARVVEVADARDRLGRIDSAINRFYKRAG
jgi:hypothetical protein